MKNPFIAAAAMMAAMLAAQREDAARTFQGKNFSFSYGHLRIPGPPGKAGDKLARKAAEGRIGICH